MDGKKNQYIEIDQWVLLKGYIAKTRFDNFIHKKVQ